MFGSSCGRLCSSIPRQEAQTMTTDVSRAGLRGERSDARARESAGRSGGFAKPEEGGSSRRARPWVKGARRSGGRAGAGGMRRLWEAPPRRQRCS
jgi:hypothetical protein